MTRYIDVTFYVQVEPEFNGLGDRVLRAKATNMTQKRPGGRQNAGTIMAPITMRIPEAAFLPLSPKITVTIPEDMINAVPIEVEATDGSV